MGLEEDGGAQTGSKQPKYTGLKMFSINRANQTDMLVGSCLLSKERIVLASLKNDIVMVRIHI